MVSLVLAWSYPAVRLVILCLLFRIHNSLSLAPSGHSVNAGLTFKCLNHAGLGTEHRTDLLLTWWVKPLPSGGGPGMSSAAGPLVAAANVFVGSGAFRLVPLCFLKNAITTTLPD
jgi:hypothetical protein